MPCFRVLSQQALFPLSSHIVVLGFESDTSVAIVWPGLLPGFLCGVQSMFTPFLREALKWLIQLEVGLEVTQPSTSSSTQSWCLPSPSIPGATRASNNWALVSFCCLLNAHSPPRLMQFYSQHRPNNTFPRHI